MRAPTASRWIGRHGQSQTTHHCPVTSPDKLNAGLSPHHRHSQSGRSPPSLRSTARPERKRGRAISMRHWRVKRLKIAPTHQAVSGGSSSQFRYELITGRRSCYPATRSSHKASNTALGRNETRPPTAIFLRPKGCQNDITKLYSRRNIPADLLHQGHRDQGADWVGSRSATTDKQSPKVQAGRWGCSPAPIAFDGSSAIFARNVAPRQRLSRVTGRFGQEGPPNQANIGPPAQVLLFRVSIEPIREKRFPCHVMLWAI
jgi:hypothetical protein